MKVLTEAMAQVTPELNAPESDKDSDISDKEADEKAPPDAAESQSKEEVVHKEDDHGKEEAVLDASI